jgi:PhnB protein
MQVQPYLSFEGRCEEAIEFYKKALGAEVEMMMRFKDSPEQPSGNDGCASPAGAENKVMHSSFKIGDTVVMATDGHCNGKANFQGISLTLNPSTEPEANRLFNALSEGGEVRMPMTKTFFSPAFGMVADRFGVSWMVVVAP